MALLSKKYAATYRRSSMIVSETGLPVTRIGRGRAAAPTGGPEGRLMIPLAASCFSTWSSLNGGSDCSSSRESANSRISRSSSGASVLISSLTLSSVALISYCLSSSRVLVVTVEAEPLSLHPVAAAHVVEHFLQLRVGRGARALVG